MKRIVDFLKSFFGFTKNISVTSPLGLEIVASSEDQNKRQNFFNDDTVYFLETVVSSIIFKKCGHQGSRSFKFNIWGNASSVELEDGPIEEVDGIKTVDLMCPKCCFEKIKQSAIRCCLCGVGILPGQAVALYHKDSKGINKKVATFVGNNALGCMTMDCCPSGGFFGGYWTYEGFRPIFNGKTVVEKVFHTGKSEMGNI